MNARDGYAALSGPAALLPYSCQQINQDDVSAVVETLRSPALTQGPRVTDFERAFCDVHQVDHGVAVCNATAGLHLACLALGAGPGKRVWTSPNSFLASANAALYCGASIDFCDIDRASRNLSVQALARKLQAAQISGTLPDIVIPVHFAGLPCDLRPLRELADRYRFKLLEDASHATGAHYNGKPVGSQYVDASVFSFHAVKVVTTAEGGMVTTPHADVADRLRLLRSHGMVRDPAQMGQPPEGAWVYEQQTLGYNYRLTDVQAALGRSQLRRLPVMQVARRALADRYDRLLQGLPLRLPARRAGCESAWHLYAVELQGDPLQAPTATSATSSTSATQRAAVFQLMRQAGIGVNVHYIPIHTQPYYRALGFKPGDFPEAEAYYAGALSLPLFPAMTTVDQDRVVVALRAALQQVALRPQAAAACSTS